MLSSAIIPLLAALPLFLAPTSAFPSRTHCVCSLVDTSNARFNPESLPTSEYTPKQRPDACSRLGPALANLHAANPDLYAEFVSHAQQRSSRTSPLDGSTPATEERPLSTTLLLHLSTHSDLSALGVVLPSAPPAPQSTAPPSIVCETHVERFPAVHDSLITLFVLKVIVYLAVLAFVAECVTLLLRWYFPRVDVRPQLQLLTKNRTLAPGFEYVPAQSALRLSGEEKRLMAVPEEAAECPFSPGVDKKQRAYRSGEWTPRLGSGRKEFEAYVVEEDDDELSRPVM